MTDTTSAELAEQTDTIDGYHLYATNFLLGEPPRLTLECPPGHCPDDHELCSLSDGCVHNLIPADQRQQAIELGALIDLALDHQADRAGYTPGPACSVMEVPGVGPTRVQGDGDMPDELKTALGTIVRAAQRKATEDLKAAGRAELVGRLVALRQTWAGRQNEAIYTRETADGPTAGIAGARADLLGQLLAELDQAVNGG